MQPQYNGLPHSVITLEKGPWMALDKRALIVPRFMSRSKQARTLRLSFIDLRASRI